MKRVLITERTVIRLFNEADRHRKLAARLTQVKSHGRANTLLELADLTDQLANDLLQELRLKKVKSL